MTPELMEQIVRGLGIMGVLLIAVVFVMAWVNRKR